MILFSSHRTQCLYGRGLVTQPLQLQTPRRRQDGKRPRRPLRAHALTSHGRPPCPRTTSPNSNPTAFEKSQPLLIFAKQMHSIASTVLTHLSTHLALPPQTLSSKHALSERSSSNLRLLHMPPQQASAAQTSLMGHADNGSVSGLFDIVGGLQVLDDTDSWCYVRSEPGHTVIDPGNSELDGTGKGLG